MIFALVFVYVIAGGLVYFGHPEERPIAAITAALWLPVFLAAITLVAVDAARARMRE